MLGNSLEVKGRKLIHLEPGQYKVSVTGSGEEKAAWKEWLRKGGAEPIRKAVQVLHCSQETYSVS